MSIYKLNKIEELQEVHRYLAKFAILRRWMITDLRRSSIEANANLLVAMGIFNYIETLGGFYKYKKQYKAKGGFIGGKARLYFVLNNLMPKTYRNVCRRIDDLTEKGCYDVLRSGLTHQYLAKIDTVKDKNIELRFTIVGCSDEEQYNKAITEKDCGLELIKVHSKFYKLLIYNARLIHDLDNAFSIYENMLNRNKKGYRKAFLLRAWETNLMLLN